jgi:phosphoribosylformylglycinamidine cyclo-ligase
MHADGAGTKGILAYLYAKETGDLSVWKGIAIDAIVMNLDDMLCVGAIGPFTWSSTIGRNKGLITGDALEQIITGTQEYFDLLKGFGLEVSFMGGETADVGDVVRTIMVDGTMACRMKRNEVITCEHIAPGDVLVSFSSYGQASYETAYNSGIGSNGLTSARHDLLKKDYATRYPETVDPAIDEQFVYNGNYGILDQLDEHQNVGQAILSPTRTYGPVMVELFQKHRSAIHGIIHCSGGGQTKCLHYLPGAMRVVKDNLLPIPSIFKAIQASAGTPWKEMYQVFNMGQRLELFTDQETAEAVCEVAAKFNIQAQISGRVEPSEHKEVAITHESTIFHYTQP